LSYLQALNKAWKELSNITENNHTVQFLSDSYKVNLDSKSIICLSDNKQAKEFISILVLHYLIQDVKGIDSPSGEWASFRQLEGGDGYYPAFHKRAIEPIIKKFGQNPKALLKAASSLSSEQTDIGDIGISITIFPKVNFLITLWLGSEEFSPDANILFDRNIGKIFPTEDVAVLSGLIASFLCKAMVS